MNRENGYSDLPTPSGAVWAEYAARAECLQDVLELCDLVGNQGKKRGPWKGYEIKITSLRHCREPCTVVFTFATPMPSKQLAKVIERGDDINRIGQTLKMVYVTEDEQED